MAIPLITGEQTEKESELLDKRYRQVIEALQKSAPEGAIIPEKIQAAREQERALRESGGGLASVGMLDPIEFVPNITGLGAAGLALGGLKKVGQKAVKEGGQELAERMARAKKLGFDTNKTLYHGTSKTFSQFDPNLKGTGAGATSEGYGAYFSNNPEIASAYAMPKGAEVGGNVVPVVVKKGRFIEQLEPLEKGDRKLFETLIKSAPDWENSIINYGDENPQKALKLALDSLMQNERKIEALHDIANVMYGGSLDLWADQLTKNGIVGFKDSAKGITVVPDSKNIRSIFANFDPAQAESKNISAGIAASGLGLSELMRQYKQEQERSNER